MDKKDGSNLIDWQKHTDVDQEPGAPEPVIDAIDAPPIDFAASGLVPTAEPTIGMFRGDLLKGKRILVTGGGTGLGRAMTERFVQLGATCFICGRRQNVVEDTAQALMREHGGVVKAFGLDIRDAAAVDAMVESIFDEGPLTGLVNNAAGNFISPTASLSPRGFDAIANIVMHGTFYVTHAVGKRWVAMAKEGRWTAAEPYRSVMSIVVTWTRNGGPFVVPSAMSKAAIDAMTKSLATEWAAYGIRLNAVGPGEIPTEGMSKRLNPGEEPGARSARTNPMARVGRMDELQNLATFLLSDGCQWLNGETIMMDGANALATGGNFYPLREWSDERWKQAREHIEAQNRKDRAERG
jgi:NAD(P)-dependent dehydrogenase (short-subunit alcohol dehydrogenase family)